MSIEIDRFRRFTGEPNRRTDLEAFGLIRSGVHEDVQTTTITISGQSREIRVSPVIVSAGESGEQVTILTPKKVDFRRAVRELTGDMSLRPLF